MNYTENYQLPQWVESDRVLMKDFNDANSKIDAALTDLGKIDNVIKMIDTVTLPSSNNSFSFDLSGVDWSACLFVGITVDIPSNSIDRELPFTCSINQNTVAGHGTASNSSFALFGPYPFTVVLLPFHTPGRTVEGIYLGQPSGVAFGACTFGELTSINFGSSTPYPAGTSATLWTVE